MHVDRRCARGIRILGGTAHARIDAPFACWNVGVFPLVRKRSFSTELLRDGYISVLFPNLGVTTSSEESRDKLGLVRVLSTFADYRSSGDKLTLGQFVCTARIGGP